MIYHPGDVVTISTWNTGAPGGGDLQLRGLIVATSFGPATTPDGGGNFTIPAPSGPSPNWTGKVISGSLTADACTIQLTIPATLKGALGRYRSRVMLIRGSVSGGRYVYLDILNNELLPDYRAASSCALDKDGGLWALVGNQAGMTVRRYGASIGSYEELGSIPNATEGTIAFDITGRLWAFVNVGAEPGNASSTWERADLKALYSDDRGRTFNAMPLPAPVAAPNHSAFVDANSNTIYPNQGARASAVFSLPGMMCVGGLDWALLPYSASTYYGLINRGAGWEVVNITDFTRVFLSARTSPSVWRSVPPTPNGDARNGALTSSYYMPEGIRITTSGNARTSSYLYEWWKSFDGVTPNAPITNRSAGPLGASIAGSTYRETPTYTLRDERTGVLHLTDGLKYWAVSPDMGRSWVDRSI